MIVKHLNWRKLIRPLVPSLSPLRVTFLPFLLFLLLLLALSLPVCKPSIPFLPNIQVLAFLRQAIITIIINIIVGMVERSKNLIPFAKATNVFETLIKKEKTEDIIVLFFCYKTAAAVPSSFFILFSLSIIESTFNVIKLIYLKCRKKGEEGNVLSVREIKLLIPEKKKQASHIHSHISGEHSSHFNLKP